MAGFVLIGLVCLVFGAWIGWVLRDRRMALIRVAAGVLASDEWPPDDTTPQCVVCGGRLPCVAERGT